MELYKELNKNKEYIKNTLYGSDDIVFKEFENNGTKCFLIYADNIVRGTTIEDAVLTNIMVRGEKNFDAFQMQNNLITVGETKRFSSLTFPPKAIYL